METLFFFLGRRHRQKRFALYTALFLLVWRDDPAVAE